MHCAAAAVAVYKEANWGMAKATTINENVRMIILFPSFFAIQMNEYGIELPNEDQPNTRY